MGLMKNVAAACCLSVMLCVLSACGGGGGGGTSPGTPTVVPTSISLQSDTGDYIGQGKSYQYSQSNSQILVNVTDARLSITVNGDNNWTSDFQLGGGLVKLQPGTYADATRYPFNPAGTAGLNWSGSGRGCNTLKGSFVINSVIYSAGVLSEIDLDFEQHCEGMTAALRGQIHWTSNDTTKPAGPVNPPPQSLWSAPAGSTPTTGNYVYLSSDAGDYIGVGKQYTYTNADAIMTLSTNDAVLTINTTGDETWTGNFKGMNTLSQLQPGYYSGLTRYPFNTQPRRLELVRQR